MIFLDEKTFSTSEDGRRHVWRPLDRAVDPRYVVQMKTSGRLNLGYWGFISVAGAGELVEVGPHMNAAQYVDLLENVLKPGVRAVMPEEDFPTIRVVQDNSGVHRAALVRDWYNNNPDFEKIDWPAYAQDLNPIENVWGNMQRSWISGALRNREELRQRVNEVWETVQNSDNICQRLIHSLPTRLAQVVQNNGYWCNY